MEGTAAVGNSQAHQMMTEVARRTRGLMLRLTSTQTVGVLRVFNEFAMSICAYSLPHARRAQRPPVIIQTQRTKLLLEYFGNQTTRGPKTAERLGHEHDKNELKQSMLCVSVCFFLLCIFFNFFIVLTQAKHSGAQRARKLI